MKGVNYWKVFLVVAVLIVSIFFLQYSVRYYTMSEDAKEDNPALTKQLREKAFRLGLDIQGGLHLVMEIDTTKLPEGLQKLPLDESEAVIRSRVDEFGVTEPTIQKVGRKRLIVDLPGISDIETAKKLLKGTALLEFKLVAPESQINALVKSFDRLLSQNPGLYSKAADTLEYAEEVKDTVITEDAIADAAKAKQDRTESPVPDDILADEKLAEAKDTAKAEDKKLSADDIFGEDTSGMDIPDELVDDQQEEDISRSPFSEIVMVRQGMPWLLVEVGDVQKVDNIISKERVKEKIPKGYELKWGNREIEMDDGYLYKQLFLLESQAKLTGKALETASYKRGSGADFRNAGKPVINLEFNSDGRKAFSRVTGANIKKHLAIVLNNVVYTAPQIQSRITQSSAQITGIGSMEEARVITIVLRAGALPAPLKIEQETAIGPSLGQDSVKKGILATVIGAAIVLLLMILYYKMSGIVADFAIVLNLIFLLAVMTMFRATLTLPGIAGIILTVGMALDANVLIFERIREELKLGKTVGAAIEGGYSRAFMTIFDANLTTFLTAFVLFMVGSGPIKGFALTLMIGLVCSMFTAIFVTRIVFDIYVAKVHPKKLSI
ncbi:MAG: protein translocase subunit SecD [Candidatus Zixiibacteriota bacterium]